MWRVPANITSSPCLVSVLGRFVLCCRLTSARRRQQIPIVAVHRLSWHEGPDESGNYAEPILQSMASHREHAPVQALSLTLLAAALIQSLTVDKSA